MNTLQIKPNDKGVVLYLNGVELEDVAKYSLTANDMQSAELTITMRIEHPQAGFAPEEIIDFASEIKKLKSSIVLKLEPQILYKAIIDAKIEPKKNVSPVNCNLTDLGIQVP